MVLPSDDTEGVIIAQGGRFGGWSLYVDDGKPAFDYNFLGLEHFVINSDTELPKGKVTLTFKFAYDGGGAGKGGLGTLLIDGKKVGEGRIERTQPAIFSADETAGVGVDDSTPVTSAYKKGDNKFTGEILKIVVDVKAIGEADKSASEKVKTEADEKMAISN